MKITYRFNESSDDSKMDIKRGVKKNDFTKDRIHPVDTPEMDPSSGLPEEGYDKGPLRLQNDSPSFEGSAWFNSNNFNDEETNKRPLHPEPDYLNHEDFHTGDDHVEIHGVEHPTKKVPFEKNDNTDSKNYDENGYIKEISEKEKNKHIYKENKNIMKNTMQEQVDRIKQMILFKEGMSFNDVKTLTEQPEGKEAISAVSAEKAAVAVADDAGVSASGLKSKESGGVEVDAVSALEKSPAAQASVKEKGDDVNYEDMVSPVSTVDNQIQNLTKTIDSLKSKLSTAEKNGDDKEITNIKSELEKNQDELTKLQSKKDSETKEPVEEPKEPVEEPKEPVKGEPNPLQTLNINEAVGMEGMDMQPNGFWSQVQFQLGAQTYTLQTTASPAGNSLGNAEYNLSVNYYSLGAENIKGTTTLISTKSGQDSEIFLKAMESLNISFNRMLVPGMKAAVVSPGGGWTQQIPSNASLSQKLTSASMQDAQNDDSAEPFQGFSKNADVAQFQGLSKSSAAQAAAVPNQFYSSQAQAASAFDSPIQAVSNDGIVVYSFTNQESLDNANAAGPVSQNAAIAAEVKKSGKDYEGPEEPNPGSPVGNFKLVGPGDSFLVGPNKFNDKTLEIIDLNGTSQRYKEGNINLKPSETLQGKIQVQELVSEEGYPLYVVDSGGNDQVFFEALRTAGIEDTQAGKFSAGKSGKIMVLVNTGGKLPEEAMDILGLKSAKGLKKVSAPLATVAKGSSVARGSYESPTFGRRAFTSRPDLKFGTSKSEYDPFGGSETGKYSAPLRAISQGNFEDMTKAELIQLISQLGKEDEREELNEDLDMITSMAKKAVKSVARVTNPVATEVIDTGINFIKKHGDDVGEAKDAFVKAHQNAFSKFYKGNKKLASTLSKSLSDGLKKIGLNESRKNVIKLTEGDLYKIVDRVLREKNR